MNVRIGVMAASVLLATASGVSAQTIAGLSAGATLSDFENPDTDDRWGFTGGLWFGLATRGSLTALEVSYTQKGGSDARIDYIETGLTGGAIAGQSNGARGRIYGGFVVAFPVSCESTGGALGATFCDNTKTEWGAPIGITLGRWSGGGFVGIDIRYTFPLSDASLEVYNNVWMFRVTMGKPTSKSR